MGMVEAEGVRFITDQTLRQQSIDLQVGTNGSR